MIPNKIQYSIYYTQIHMQTNTYIVIKNDHGTHFSLLIEVLLPIKNIYIYVYISLCLEFIHCQIKVISQDKAWDHHNMWTILESGWGEGSMEKPL